MKKSIGSGRGSVYNILLKALQSGDKYGYEICKEIEEKSNGTYILKQPSLYSGLKRLEAQKLITSYWKDSDLGGRRHYYSLTPEGSQKIENSNFSWEDTRDNLVNSLFEKSEIENDIEDVVKQVDTLKQQTEDAKQYQQDIDEIISSTQNLVAEKEINEYDEQKQEYEQNSTTDLFAYGNSDDLFSMYGNFDASKQTEDAQEANVDSENITNDIDEDVKEDDQVDNEEDIKVYNIEDYQEDTNQSTPLDKNYNESDNNDENDELSSQTQTDLLSQTESDSLNENKSDLLNEVEGESLNDTQIAQENVDNLTKDDNLNNTQLDLFSYINNAQTNNTSIDDEIDEEETNDDQNFEDIIKNFTTYEAENKLENTKPDSENELNKKEFETENIKEFDTKNDLSNDDTVTFNTVKDNVEEIINEQTNYVDNLNQSQTQTSKTESDDTEIALQENEEKDFLSLYKNNHMSTSSFADNSKFETVEKSYFNDSENFFDIDSFNFNSPTSKNFDEQTDENVSNKDLIDEKLETEQANLSNENQNKYQPTSDIDYANIFGDLMTSNKIAEDVVSAGKEIDNDLKDDLQVNNQNNTHTGFVDELPRINTNQNDINRTLMVDQNMLNELNEQYNDENPFEKLDSKIKEQFDENTEVEQNNAYVQNNNFKESNIPFDRKYGHVLDNFEIPDYQVRYYKKSTNKTSTSKFISINKLNLVSSIIVSILLCILTTATLICSSLKVSPNGTQIVCYALSYIAIIFMLMFNLFKYETNKNKKILELNKNQIITNSFFAVVLIILTIALNILFGMNLTNILDYSASFIIPLCYSLILFIQPLVKKFLSRFSSFYLN